MGPNPPLGVFYHWVGGLAAASFYIPYRKVKVWSWETYWLVGGVFSWIIAPWLLATLIVPDLWGALRAAPGRNLLWAYFFGVLWGIGGLTFGLSMRYLGIALGYAIALGLCAAFGTLVPPIFSGEIGRIAGSTDGRVVLLGIAVCLAGIAASGMAGVTKERELTEAQKKDVVSEFSFVKGLLVALFAGVMSSCFAYGLAAGKPLAEITKTQLIVNGRQDLWQNLPVLVIVLLGGFTTNFIWCVTLNIKNRSGREYLGLGEKPSPSPLLANYLFSALAGITWYLQFFFYSMGTTKMGKYEYSSWTLHMGSIIIFSTLWGLALGEWKGTSSAARIRIAAGLALLIGSTLIIGYGNYLKSFH